MANYLAPSQFPWCIMAVCTRWRDIVVNTPRFWNTIAVDFSCFSGDPQQARNRQALKKVLRMLRLSGTLPLHVILVDADDFISFENCEGGRRIFDLLLAYSNRWQSLFIEAERTVPYLLEPLRGALRSLKYLRFAMRLLRCNRLDVDPPDIDELVPTEVFEDAPVLEHVELIGLRDVRYLCPLPWSQLKSYSCLFGEISDALCVLRLCTNLETFRARRCRAFLSEDPDKWYFVGTNDPAMHHEDDPRPTGRGTITFPRLKVLHIQTQRVDLEVPIDQEPPPRSIPMYLEGLSFPALETARLQWQRHTPAWANVISQFNCLSLTFLDLVVHNIKSSVLIMTLLDFPALTHLGLYEVSNYVLSRLVYKPPSAGPQGDRVPLRNLRFLRFMNDGNRDIDTSLLKRLLRSRGWSPALYPSSPDHHDKIADPPVTRLEHVWLIGELYTIARVNTLRRIKGGLEYIFPGLLVTVAPRDIIGDYNWDETQTVDTRLYSEPISNLWRMETSSNAGGDDDIDELTIEGRYSEDAIPLRELEALDEDAGSELGSGEEDPINSEDEDNYLLAVTSMTTPDYHPLPDPTFSEERYSRYPAKRYRHSYGGDWRWGILSEDWRYGNGWGDSDLSTDSESSYAEPLGEVE